MIGIVRDNQSSRGVKGDEQQTVTERAQMEEPAFPMYCLSVKLFLSTETLSVTVYCSFHWTPDDE